MKRKLVLFLAILSAMLCLFAITAAAAEIPEWTGITEVSGMSDKSTFGDDGKAGATSRVLMSDGVTYPAYYVCKNQESLALDLSTLNSKASKSYEKSDIIRIEIPKGTTTISAALNLSSGCSGLVSVDIPYGVTTIKQLAFRSSGISNPIVIPDSCTTIEQYAFKGTNIPSIVIPSSVTSFGSDCISECPSITAVYCKCANIPEKAFYDNDNLSIIELENTVTIGNNAFCNPNGGILNITSLELPSTVTSIGQYAFTRTKLTSLVIPASVSTMGAAAFQGSTTLEKVVVLGSVLANETFKDCSALKEAVFTEKFVTFGNSALGSTPNNSTFISYYTGTDYERLKTLCSSTTRFKSAKCYSYSDYDQNNYTDQYMLIYDTNLCVAAFGGKHTEPVGDRLCTEALKCTVCNLVLEEAHESHDVKAEIEYKDGVFASGTKTVGCTRCSYADASTIDAIITYKGFSTPTENGKRGLAIGFVVNEEALSAYKATGKTLTFGAYVASYANVTNDNVTDMYNYAKAIKADVTENELTYFSMKITGFEKGDNDDTKLCLGAYVVENGAVSYLQAGEAIEGCNFLYTTYNLAYANSSKQ